VLLNEVLRPGDRFAAFRRWWATPGSRWVKDPLAAFLVTRLIVLLGAYFPLVFGIQLYTEPPNGREVPGIWGVWARWDSNWYVQIADEGYSYSPDLSVESSVAFFPLYPIAIKALALLTGNALAAGILINNGSFLLALMFFYQLAGLDIDSSATRRAVFYLAAFPGSFFFSSAYSEGLFLLVSILATLCARRQSWYWAAFWAALSAASRAPGFLIWGIVGLEWLRTHGWTLATVHQRESWDNLVSALRKHWRQVGIMILVMTSGLWLYMLYLQIQFGDPLIFQTSGDSWFEFRFGLLRPLEIIARDLAQSFSANPPKHVLPGFAAVDVGTFIMIGLLSVPIARRFRDSYAIYCLVHPLLALYGYTQGMLRYAAVLFPLFMLLALWGRRPWLNRVLIYTFLPLQCLLTALYVNWIFIG